MADITISDWTAALQAGDPYRLIGGGAQFSGEYNTVASDADTVALWRFDEVDGGAFVDEKGAYPLTIYSGAACGSEWLDDYGDHGVNATSYSRSAASYPDWDKTWTLEGWVNLQTFDSTQDFFFGTSENWLAARTNGEWETQLRRVTQYEAPGPVVGDWYHVALEARPLPADDQARLYVSGVLLHTWTSGSITDPDEKFTFGARQAGAAPCDCWLDDWRMSNVWRYTSNFTPARFVVAQIRTADGAIDGGEEYAWTRSTGSPEKPGCRSSRMQRTSRARRWTGQQNQCPCAPSHPSPRLS